MELRNYQSELIEGIKISLRSNKRVIAQLPTGGGKTVTFSYIVLKALESGKKVLVLTDRIELFNQSAVSLGGVGVSSRLIKSGSKLEKGNCYVSMVETLSRRLGKKEYQELLNSIDLLIIDECHKRIFDKVIEQLNENVIVIGFTATPHRDGSLKPLSDQYKGIVNGVEIPYLVKSGFLAKPKYYGVPIDLSGVGQKGGDYDKAGLGKMYEEKKIFKGVLYNWEKLTLNTKTIIFSSTVKNSKEVVSAFMSKGYDCKHLDSKMGKSERQQVLDWFKSTPHGILSNVGILTTGFDEPTIETVILYRATRSLPLYLQMVGRGSRCTDVKKQFSILDFGNNITSFGFWHSPQTWSLEGQKPRPLGESILKNCPKCEAFIHASATNCKHCNHTFTKLIKEQEIASLKLLDPKELRSLALKGGLNEMIKLSKAKLISPYWCLHQVKQRSDAESFISQMGWKSSWIHVNGNRYGWY